MFTALLVVAAILLVAALVAVFVQCVESPSMWFFHAVCGTPTFLFKLLGEVLSAIFDANNS